MFIKHAFSWCAIPMFLVGVLVAGLLPSMGGTAVQRLNFLEWHHANIYFGELKIGDLKRGCFGHLRCS